MIVTIDQKSKSCPGVNHALDITQDYLRRGHSLISAGELIHNQREMERLKTLGLQIIPYDALGNCNPSENQDGAAFLVRAHGESDKVIDKALKCGLQILDGTCAIVAHSQQLVQEHALQGWGIVIVGKKDHPEVKGLAARAKGNDVIISSLEDVDQYEFNNRSLLIAQSTINPKLFSDVRHKLNHKISNLKIVDTTCRYLKTRQEEIRTFAKENDVCIIVGGKNSSNSRLLYETAREINPKTYFIAHPDEVNAKWIKKAKSVGISGGASTPRWQLDELKQHLENNKNKKNPNGLKNKKGGILSWWKLKNHKNN